jgi:hypothetical protein
VGFLGTNTTDDLNGSDLYPDNEKDLKKMSEQFSQLKKSKYVKSNRTNSAFNLQDSTKSNSGRYKLFDEEKARQVPLRLYKKHLEILEWLPGDNNGEKIRKVLEDNARLKMRERRQVELIDFQIKKVYELGLECTNPEMTKGDRGKQNALITQFLKGLEFIDRLIQNYFFEIADLKMYLEKESFNKLDSIILRREKLKGMLKTYKTAEHKGKTTHLKYVYGLLIKSKIDPLKYMFMEPMSGKYFELLNESEFKVKIDDRWHSVTLYQERISMAWSEQISREGLPLHSGQKVEIVQENLGEGIR